MTQAERYVTLPGSDVTPERFIDYREALEPTYQESRVDVSPVPEDDMAHAMGKNRARGSRRFGMQRQYPTETPVGNDNPMEMPQTSHPGSLT